MQSYKRLKDGFDQGIFANMSSPPGNSPEILTNQHMGS